MNIVNNAIVSLVKLMPKRAVFIFAKKYIAGTKLMDAVNVVKDLNSKGIVATMDVLGEAVETKNEAAQAKAECLETLDIIKNENLNANLSVKPTQLGLMIDAEFCYQQMTEILTKAKEYNNFVRIDMEDSSTTDFIIALYKRLREEFSNVGIVVQSYLRRTLNDVTDLDKGSAHYRLCKGIYVEPEKIAYKGYQEVRDNYMAVLRKMFEDKVYVGIATHDDYLVEACYKLIEEMKIPKDMFEFQMLYGVKESLRDDINAKGYKIRIYVPYGEHWYHYSVRRLQENPKVAWYITKSLFTFN